MPNLTPDQPSFRQQRESLREAAEVVARQRRMDAAASGEPRDWSKWSGLGVAWENLAMPESEVAFVSACDPDIILTLIAESEAYEET